jgi:hypothetical protein
MTYGSWHFSVLETTHFMEQKLLKFVCLGFFLFVFEAFADQDFSRIEKSIQGLQSVAYVSEGKGIDFAMGRKKYFKTSMDYKAHHSRFIYTTYDSKMESDAKSTLHLMPSHTVAYDGELFQVFMHPEKLIQVSRKAGVEALNYAYSTVGEIGVFEPYLFIPLLAHTKRSGEGDVTSQKFNNPHSSGFFPQMKDFTDKEALNLSRRLLPVSDLVKISMNGAECQKFTVSIMEAPLKKVQMSVFFGERSKGIPFRWEKKVEGHKHSFLVWEAEIDSMESKSGFIYFSRSQKQQYLSTDSERPHLISQVNYSISQCAVNSLDENTDFTIDVALAERVWDVDTDKWILLPK